MTDRPTSPEVTSAVIMVLSIELVIRGMSIGCAVKICVSQAWYNEEGSKRRDETNRAGIREEEEERLR